MSCFSGTSKWGFYLKHKVIFLLSLFCFVFSCFVGAFTSTSRQHVWKWNLTVMSIFSPLQPTYIFSQLPKLILCQCYLKCQIKTLNKIKRLANSNVHFCSTDIKPSFSSVPLIIRFRDFRVLLKKLLTCRPWASLLIYSINVFEQRRIIRTQPAQKGT